MLVLAYMAVFLVGCRSDVVDSVTVGGNRSHQFVRSYSYSLPFIPSLVSSVYTISKGPRVSCSAISIWIPSTLWVGGRTDVKSTPF